MSIYDFAQDVRGDGRRQRLIVDEDFSWSDPPSKRRSQAVVEEAPRRQPETHLHPDPFPEPAPAHVDETMYDDDDEIVDRDMEVRDLRAEQGLHPDRYLQDADEDVYEPDLEEIAADELYVDQRSGGLALSSSGRRTIVITGHGAERNLPARPRREASLRAYERSSFKPDRIALWAFLLALALLLGATTSSHAATLVHHLPH